MNQVPVLPSLVLAFALSYSPVALAEDLGIKAPVFKVDRDGRDQLKERVRKLPKERLDSFWQTFRDRNLAAIKNPAPLGIPSDFRVRSELRDLKYVLPSDIRDQNGRTVARKGTLIEPIKALPLVNGLVFIDGRDQRQIDYAIARGRKEPLKIVLTAGSPFDLRVKYRNEMWRGTPAIPFYFDQKKMIITQLKQLYGIDVTVPMVLSQRGTRLALEYGLQEIR